MQSFYSSFVALFQDVAYGAILLRDQFLFSLDTAYLSPHVLLFFSFGLLFFFLLQVFFIRLHLQNIHALFQRETALQRNSEKHIQRQLFVLIEELRQYNARKSPTFVPEQPTVPSVTPTMAKSSPVAVDLRSDFRTEKKEEKTTHVATVVDDALIPASVVASLAHTPASGNDRIDDVDALAPSLPLPKRHALRYAPPLPTYFVSPASRSAQPDPSVKPLNTRTFAPPTPIFDKDSTTSPFAIDDDVPTPVADALPSDSPLPQRGVIEFEEIRRQMRLLSTETKAKVELTSERQTTLNVDPKSFAFVPPSNTANS